MGYSECDTGDDGCCDRGSYKCGYGEGDCDSDSDCSGSLACGNNNCRLLHNDHSTWDSTDDCCV